MPFPLPGASRKETAQVAGAGLAWRSARRWRPLWDAARLPRARRGRRYDRRDGRGDRRAGGTGPDDGVLRIDRPLGTGVGVPVGSGRLHVSPDCANAPALGTARSAPAMATQTVLEMVPLMIILDFADSGVNGGLMHSAAAAMGCIRPPPMLLRCLRLGGMAKG
ncbi:hypothetical protein ACFSHP_26575 [Novosphingobium panipatense]